MADLCQDINRVSSFSRYLNGTNTNLPFELTYQRLNGALPWRKYSIKAPTKWKTSVYALTEICLQWSKQLDPKWSQIKLNSWYFTYNDSSFSVTSPNDLPSIFLIWFQICNVSCRNIISVSTYNTCLYSGSIWGKNSLWVAQGANLLFMSIWSWNFKMHTFEFYNAQCSKI